MAGELFDDQCASIVIRNHTAFRRTIPDAISQKNIDINVKNNNELIYLKTNKVVYLFQPKPNRVIVTRKKGYLE